MKKKSVTMTIKEKRAMLGRIDGIIKGLEEARDYVSQSYEVIGVSDEQDVDWRTKEPLWEDEEHTKPIYKKIYGYVDKTELDEDDKAEIAAIDAIIDVLMQLV